MVVRRTLAAVAYLPFYSLSFVVNLSRPSPSFVFCARMSTKNSPTVAQGEWQPLDPESLVSAPCLIEQTLCRTSDTQAQLAKDFDYAKAVLDSWKEDEELSWKAVWRPVIYADEHGSNLHGYCVRREPKECESDKIPGIIFFHTGAGPHDMFLLYKAVALVNSLEGDCVVFIADILGDESGWAWDPDRTRYNAAREKVLAVETNANRGPYRPLLQQRIQAALDYLSSKEYVDRYAAFGWCLGGHSILEISRMIKVRSAFRALVTFHGIFDGLPTPPESNEERDDSCVDVLICHGTEDPFVSDDNIERALATFQAHRFRTSLLQLPAKHGFTNPAQDFNDSPAFAFHAESATKSWRQATNLVRQKLW